MAMFAYLFIATQPQLWPGDDVLGRCEAETDEEAITKARLLAAERWVDDAGVNIEVFRVDPIGTFVQ